MHTHDATHTSWTDSRLFAACTAKSVCHFGKAGGPSWVPHLLTPLPLLALFQVLPYFDPRIFLPANTVVRCEVRCGSIPTLQRAVQSPHCNVRFNPHTATYSPPATCQSDANSVGTRLLVVSDRQSPRDSTKSSYLSSRQRRLALAHGSPPK